MLACVADPFYKIAAEALLVLQELVRVLWPLDGPRKLDPEPYVGEMSAATLARLRATDLDQEVKERAISCMGHLVGHLGDRLGDDLEPSLLLLLDRLRNEITRLSAVKALTLVAVSPLPPNRSLALFTWMVATDPWPGSQCPATALCPRPPQQPS